MTKREFLNRLETAIILLPKSERYDIINDYEEHFRVGASEGKTEHEVCIELGSPEELGVSYLENAGVTNPTYVEQQIQARSKMDPSLKAVLIILFIVFVLFPLAGTVFGFFAAIFGIVFGFGAAAAALVVAGVYCGGFLAAALICLAVAFVLLAILLTIGGIALIQLLVKLCKLGWNYIKNL